jgi:hypothetical protein
VLFYNTRFQNYLISLSLAAFQVSSLINPIFFLLTLNCLKISIFSIVGEWIANIFSIPNAQTFLLTVIVFSKAVFQAVFTTIHLNL